MEKHRNLRTSVFAAFLTLAVLMLMPWVASASNDAATEADCRMCHCYNVPDAHHVLVTTGQYQCLNCHEIKWNDASQSFYTEVIRDCIVCHTSVVGTTHHVLARAGTYACLDCHKMTLDPETQQYTVDLNFTCITSSRSTNLPPIASAGPYQSISAGQSATFSGAGSYDPNGTVVNYSWEFGDGSTGSGISPSHTYITPGTFTVTLSVTDNQGAIGKGTTTVTVLPAGATVANCRSCHYDTVPAVNYGSTAYTHHSNYNSNTPIICPSVAPKSGCPNPTSLTYQCTTCHDPLAPEHDCTKCHGYSSHAAAHDHAKIDAAVCQQCHKPNVVDEHADHGLSCNVCHNSSNTAVTAAINKGKGPNGADVFCYDCHGPTDHAQAHDKAVIPYQDCGACHKENVVTEHAKFNLSCSVCHKNSDPNILGVIARASGASGQVVYCADCHSSQSLRGFGNHVKQHDKTVIPAGACPDAPSGTDIVTYHESISTSTKQIHCLACHTSSNTTYVLAINNGMSGELVWCGSCHTGMCVPNQPPQAAIVVTPGQTVQTNTTVNFSGAASFDPDGTIAGYAWDFGDGFTSTGANASHSYMSAGTYKVTLIVTDNRGSTGTTTTTVTAQAAPVSNTVAADQVLWIQNLSRTTNSDNSVSSSYRADITARFKDGILTDTFTVSNRSPYKVLTLKSNKDAGSYSQVSLGIYVKALYYNTYQTIRIYPYGSDGSSLNAYYYVTPTISKTGWTQIDVTSLAARMKGFGWMKFRITCTSSSLDLAEGNFVLK